MTVQSTLRTARASFLAAAVTLTGCATGGARDPMQVIERVDLERFMGQWYVIANIPTLIEKGAHNAVESYRLDSDGSIATSKKSVCGPRTVKLPTRCYVVHEAFATNKNFPFVLSVVCT